MDTWRDTASQQAQDDFQELFDVLLPWAKRSRARYRHFIPVGGTITVDGEVAMHTAGDGRSATGALETLREGIFSDRHLYRAVALAVDTRLPQRQTDAIRFDLEHVDGAAISIVVPYKRSLLRRKTTLGEMTTYVTNRHVWVAPWRREDGDTGAEQPMQRDDFYVLVEAARDNSVPFGPPADPSTLSKVLADLEDNDLEAFVLAFDEELARLNRWAIWGAGYAAEGGMSDDAFHYFRAWLIGKGRAAVDAVLEDPDALADFLEEEPLDNEELEYAGLELLEERGLPDPRLAHGKGNVDGEPAGTPFNEEDVKRAYPRITAARS